MFTATERAEICGMCDEKMSDIIEHAAYVKINAQQTPEQELSALYNRWASYAAIYNKATLGTLQRGREMFDENLYFAVRRLVRQQSVVLRSAC